MTDAQAELEVIESADVESIELSDAADALATDPQLVSAEIVLAPEVLAGGASDTVLDEVIAGIEVQEHYALAIGDEAPHEGATAKELVADETVLPEANEQPGAEESSTVAAPKAARGPCVYYLNKTDRIKARRGSNLGD